MRFSSILGLLAVPFVKVLGYSYPDYYELEARDAADLYDDDLLDLYADLVARHDQRRILARGNGKPAHPVPAVAPKLRGVSSDNAGESSSSGAGDTARRAIQLISFRQNPSQRAHFSIFVPSLANPRKGSLIHAVGAPMAGFSLEFKRNYDPEESKKRHTVIPLGEVPASSVVDPVVNVKEETVARDDLERIAEKVPTPRASVNFLAPVNDVSNAQSRLRRMTY